MDKLGYFGVVLKDTELFAGAFLMDTPPLRSSTATIMDMLRTGPLDGSQVFSGVPGIVAEDQPLVGALCALVVEGLRVSREDLVGTGALGVHLLTGETFFMIRGTIEARGMRTQFERMGGVADEEQARRYVNADPDVVVAKRRAMSYAVLRAKSGRSGRLDA